MIVCNWCEETFETHAKLYVHHLVIGGTPNCPKHPDDPLGSGELRGDEL